MCQFKSAICLKDRVFVPDYNSHSKMLEELHIEDDFVHASKVFVRVELVPEDGDKTSDVDEWKLNVDQDVLPDWWNENDCLPRIKAAVKVWCYNHILRTGMHTVRDGIWYAYGNATVVAFDNASVKAYNSAGVEAWGNASVEAFDNASVKAYNSAGVEAWGNASVKAFDDARVKAYNSAGVKAYGNASVKAYGNASVEAFDDASVKLPKYFQTLKPVLLHDKAICINYKDHTIQSPVKWEQK
nr:MAG TPA: hypothetical protein [Caudoviricetes sp.]